MATFSRADVTSSIDLAQHAAGTGHLRKQRPIYENLMPPCNSACPAGENIQAWLASAQAGDYQIAFEQIMADNPFPAVMGRICVKPCETGCNRNHIDDTVNIHAVERFIGDLAIEKGWTIPPPANETGKRIMVVGAGPGGLSAAYHLRLLGHQVEVFDKQPMPGGLLYLGVPEYRLPQSILQAEIQRILNLGIPFHGDCQITNLLQTAKEGHFDAIYLSTGSHRERAFFFDGNTSIPVLTAIDFLTQFRNDSLPELGKDVVVYGGGKMAIYLARVLRRLGCQPIVLFPGDSRKMAASDFEADEAIAEGVEVKLLHSIVRIDDNQLTIGLMQMVKGKPEPTGETLFLEANALIIAMGQEAESSLYKEVPGVTMAADGGIIINNQTRMSGYDGLFAGGDMLPGEQRSSTTAIGHGKKAARNINAWLQGKEYSKPGKPQTAGYKRLHMWFRTDAPPNEEPRLSPLKAIRHFEEVVSGLGEPEARYEAARCLSCGNCFECDGCFGACPEDAIIKLGKGNGYSINYDVCTGCAVCFEQCPCHAIQMIPEPVNADQP